MIMKNRRILTILVWLQIIFCVRAGAAADNGKIKVVTSLFPIYDFTRQVGRDRVDVSLLLPPGVEAHNFEPKPRDLVQLNNADIFIYTGKYMEPWVGNLLRGIASPKLLIIDASQGITLLQDNDEEKGFDPHIWMDLSNAAKMVETIAAGLAQKDPGHAKFYQSNAGAYKSQLGELDNRFSQTLKACPQKILIQGGHFAFGYLAKRYNLRYISAYKGFTPDAEPTARNIAEMVETIKHYQVKYIFYEELLNPRVAETLAQETGASLLKLSAAHNITRDEMAQGITFISILENDLASLKVGLQCP